MQYSVWSPKTKTYTYYETSQGFEDDPPAPSSRGGTQLGAAPGQLTYTLPADARMTGTGVDAKGVVIHPLPDGALGIPGLGFLEAESGYVMVVAGAYLAWRYFTRKRRGR